MCGSARLRQAGCDSVSSLCGEPTVARGRVAGEDHDRAAGHAADLVEPSRQVAPLVDAERRQGSVEVAITEREVLGGRVDRRRQPVVSWTRMVALDLDRGDLPPKASPTWSGEVDPDRVRDDRQLTIRIRGLNKRVNQTCSSPPATGETREGGLQAKALPLDASLRTH